MLLTLYLTILRATALPSSVRAGAFYVTQARSHQDPAGRRTPNWAKQLVKLRSICFKCDKSAKNNEGFPHDRTMGGLITLRLSVCLLRRSFVYTNAVTGNKHKAWADLTMTYSPVWITLEDNNDLMTGNSEGVSCEMFSPCSQNIKLHVQMLWRNKHVHDYCDPRCDTA